jgi:hypothetical protein
VLGREVAGRLLDAGLGGAALAAAAAGIALLHRAVVLVLAVLDRLLLVCGIVLVCHAFLRIGCVV